MRLKKGAYWLSIRFKLKKLKTKIIYIDVPGRRVAWASVGPVRPQTFLYSVAHYIMRTQCRGIKPNLSSDPDLPTTATGKNHSHKTKEQAPRSLLPLLGRDARRGF